MPTTAADDPSAAPPVVVTAVVPVGTDLDGARRVVDSLRRNARTAVEVVAVARADAPGSAAVAHELADTAVALEGRAELPVVWNRGLAEARGRYVAFCAGDASVSEGWDERLVEAAGCHPAAAVVVPAVGGPDDPDATSGAGRPEALAPFSPAPPPVLYLLPVDLARELGPWDEGYLDGGGAEVDLCFTAWVNERDVVVDPRVRAEVAGPAAGAGGGADAGPSPAPATGGPTRRFRDRWQGDAPVTRLEATPVERFERNRATARAVAGWMGRDAAVRDDDANRMRRQLRAMGSVNRQLQAQVDKPATRLERTARGVVGPSARRAVNRLSPATVRRLHELLSKLPPSTEQRVRRLARRLGIRRGPATD